MTWVSPGRCLLPAIWAFVACGWLLEQPAWRGLRRDLVHIASTSSVTVLAFLFTHGFWAI